jgi:hypothetical protein
LTCAHYARFTLTYIFTVQRWIMECRISESFVRDSRMWQVFNSNWQFQQMASTFLRRVHYRDIPSTRVSLFFNIFVFSLYLIRILLKFACREIIAWYYWRLSFMFNFPRFIDYSFCSVIFRKQTARSFLISRSFTNIYVRNIIYRWSYIFTMIWSIDIIIIIYHELSISAYNSSPLRVKFATQ